MFMDDFLSFFLLVFFGGDIDTSHLPNGFKIKRNERSGKVVKLKLCWA